MLRTRRAWTLRAQNQAVWVKHNGNELSQEPASCFDPSRGRRVRVVPFPFHVETCNGDERADRCPSATSYSHHPTSTQHTTHTHESHAVPAAPPSPPPSPNFASHGLLRPRSRCSHSQQPTLPLLPLLPPRHEAAAQHHPSSHDPPLHSAHPPSFQTARLPSGLASGLATTPPLVLAWVGGWVVETTMGRR